MRSKILLLIVFVLLLIFGICTMIYGINLRCVNSDDTLIEIDIKSGMSVSSVISLLDDNHLIRSEFITKLYTKFNDVNVEAGLYELSSSMSTKEIFNILSSGKVTDKYNISLTFKEGKNINWYASLIESSTDNTKDDVYNLLKDDSYIDSLISKYWFLTDDIKNSDIYYPLEGYLFPETYTFSSTSVSVREIFEKMLDHTDKILSKYKSDIESRNLNIHEFLTLASIVELEETNSDDRSMVAGIFYNRLEAGWSLGSDVTSYYAVQKDMGEYPIIYQEWIDYDSPYNTRLSKMAGKLPVGPVGNPGESSIKASINPTDSNYYYFVMDCKLGHSVYATTAYEFNNLVSSIKRKGCEF